MQCSDLADPFTRASSDGGPAGARKRDRELFTQTLHTHAQRSLKEIPAEAEPPLPPGADRKHPWRRSSHC
ncbi:hypothetical protein ACOMHN_049260 [Nucella lapillus]